MPFILTIHGTILLSGLAWIGVLLFRGRRRLALLVALLTPIALLAWYGLTAVDRVASWIYPHDTVYAARFTPARFDSIAGGMATRDLLQRLGEPLDKRRWEDGREYWYYSRAGRRFQNYW